jgi:hypothetical protein
MGDAVVSGRAHHLVSRIWLLEMAKNPGGIEVVGQPQSTQYRR